VASKHFENRARRQWWSVHVEAWRRSGLSRARYCRAHRLTEGTFVRWLNALEGADGARKAAELLREQRLLRRRRGPSPLCKSKRSIAVQAFWAMHVEAMTWSGMAAAHYAAAHHISAISLRRWRDLLEGGEVEVDWRARLHPSARPKISSGVSSAAKTETLETSLTEAPKSEPPPDRRVNRRSFTDEEKRAIVMEAEQAGVSVAAICRRHGVATSMVFRWRADLGLGKAKPAKLAAVTLADGRTGVRSTPFVLYDLLQPPVGMAAVDLPDGRRVFAPAGADPDAVRRHVAEQETGR
jgi:hypothetical protein